MNNYLEDFRMNMKYYRERLGISQTELSILCDCGTGTIGGITGLLRYASGTNNALRGLSLVGEAGPELVRFNGGEQVLNNRNTNKALSEVGNKASVFNVTFNNTQDTTAFAMMSQLKQYQKTLAFNGVL